MPVEAITLIHEKIHARSPATIRPFNERYRPHLEVALIRLAEKGIFEDGEELAKINYIQSATGKCDYIIQLEAENIDKLMKAINFIRQIEQVNETETHVGQVLYRKK